MKKYLSLFLCLILLFGLLPMTAPARAATALAISSVKPYKTSAVTGSTVTWTATAFGGTGTFQYYFNVYKDGTKVASRAYSTANTFSYTLTEPGSYKVRVYVKDADGTKVSKLSDAVTVAPLSLGSVKADKTGANVGETVTWTASASGGAGTLQYYFSLYKDGAKFPTRAYSTVNTFSYTPAEPGNYRVRSYVKDADGTKISKLSTEIAVTKEPLTLSSVKADKTNATVGETVTWTASASGGTGSLKYYFNLYRDGTKIASRTYSSDNTYSYTPADAGTYKVRVYVKDAADTKVNTLSSGVKVAVPTPLSISSIKADKTSAASGETVTWTASASGGTGTLQYFFIVYQDGTKVASRAYGTANTFSYIVTEPGTYKARVYVKDANGAKVNKLSGSTVHSGSFIYIYSTDVSQMLIVSGQPASFYCGLLNGVPMSDLRLDSPPEKVGFAAYIRDETGLYTLSYLPAGNGSATGVRTVTLNADNDKVLMRDKNTLYLKSTDGWKSLSLDNVRVRTIGNAAAITTISISNAEELFQYANAGLKMTITLVENVFDSGVHSVGGGVIYVTEITQ